MREQKMVNEFFFFFFFVNFIYKIEINVQVQGEADMIGVCYADFFFFFLQNSNLIMISSYIRYSYL